MSSRRLLALVVAGLATAACLSPETVSFFGEELPSGNAGQGGSAGSPPVTTQGGQGGSGGAPAPGGSPDTGGQPNMDPDHMDPDRGPLYGGGGQAGAGPMLEGPRCAFAEESMRCPPGSFCTEPENVCVEGCEWDAHCFGLGHCDSVARRCQECVRWLDCLEVFGGARLVCDQGTCKSCDERLRCPEDLQCFMGVCDLSDLGPPDGQRPSESDASTDERDEP